MDSEKEPIELNETESEQSEQQPDSTIFTKPDSDEIKNRSLSGTKKRRNLLIALSAAVLLTAGAVFGVLKLVPDINNKKNSDDSGNISVKTVSPYNIEKILINNSHGTLELNSKLVQSSSSSDGSSSSGSDSSNSTEVEWSLKGYDSSLIASSSLGSLADNIASLYAMREMPDHTLDYGFDKPLLTADVFMRDNAGQYTITVGNISPDKSGYYLKVSSDDKIYLATISTVETLNATPESLADTIIYNTPTLEGVTKTSDKKYFDDNGAISKFDSIVLSGKKYGNGLTFTPLPEGSMADYMVKTDNFSRYADTDKAKALFGIVSNGAVAIETYKLQPTQDDLKKYKLIDPEISLDINFGSNSVKLRASMYDTKNNYYAVTINGKDAIYAMTADALSMLSPSKTEFYNSYVFLENIKDLSNISVQTPKGSYSFDVSYDEDKEKLSASMNGKEIDSDLLSAYYAYYAIISPEEQSSYVNASPEVTATFTFNDSSRAAKKLEFIKQSDRRYLVVLDGNKMGTVSSTVVDHLTVYAKYVVDKKGIPDAA